MIRELEEKPSNKRLVAGSEAWVTTKRKLVAKVAIELIEKRNPMIAIPRKTVLVIFLINGCLESGVIK